jgi:hypothetical protein
VAEIAPDPSFERYAKAWKRYDRTDRRRIMRAVNRMQPLDDPAEAALGVLFARRQRRMWTRWSWIYPLIPAAIAIPRGWEAVLVNLLIGGVAMVLFASAFTWRAKRSERIQLEVIEAAQKRRRSGSPKKRAKADDPAARRRRAKGGARGARRR